MTSTSKPASRCSTAAPTEPYPTSSTRLSAKASCRRGAPLTDVLTADEVGDAAQGGDDQADHELGRRGIVHPSGVAQPDPLGEVLPDVVHAGGEGLDDLQAAASSRWRAATRGCPCSAGRRTSCPPTTSAGPRRPPTNAPRRHRVRRRGSRGRGTARRRGARRRTLPGVPASPTVTERPGLRAPRRQPSSCHRRRSSTQTARADGSRLAVWDNGGVGLPVLVCNGLGYVSVRLARPARPRLRDPRRRLGLPGPGRLGATGRPAARSASRTTSPTPC